MVCAVCRHGVLCSQTAFVGVETSLSHTEAAKKVTVPLGQSAALSRERKPDAIAQVKQIMSVNIDRVLQRGDALESLLLQQTADLAQQSMKFSAQSRSLKKSGGVGCFSCLLQCCSCCDDGCTCCERSAPAAESVAIVPHSVAVAAASPPSTPVTALAAPQKYQAIDAPAAYPTGIVSPSRDLTRVAALQTFAGHWTLTDAFAAAAGVSLAELQALQAQTGTSAEVCATLVALEVIAAATRGRADAEETWGLLVAKAKRWLATQPQAAGVDESERRRQMRQALRL